MKKLKRFTNELIKTYNLNPEFVVESEYCWQYEDNTVKDGEIHFFKIRIKLDTDPDSVIDSSFSIHHSPFDMSSQFHDFESLQFAVNVILRELDVVQQVKVGIQQAEEGKITKAGSGKELDKFFEDL